MDQSVCLSDTCLWHSQYFLRRWLQILTSNIFSVFNVCRDEVVCWVTGGSMMLYLLFPLQLLMVLPQLMGQALDFSSSLIRIWFVGLGFYMFLPCLTPVCNINIFLCFQVSGLRLFALGVAWNCVFKIRICIQMNALLLIIRSACMFVSDITKLRFLPSFFGLCPLCVFTTVIGVFTRCDPNFCIGVSIWNLTHKVGFDTQILRTGVQHFTVLRKFSGLTLGSWGKGTAVKRIFIWTRYCFPFQIKDVKSKWVKSPFRLLSVMCHRSD